jgi:hypothetical protein
MSTTPRLREEDRELLIALLSQARRPLTTAELVAAFRATLAERVGQSQSSTRSAEEE